MASSSDQDSSDREPRKPKEAGQSEQDRPDSGDAGSGDASSGDAGSSKTGSGSADSRTAGSGKAGSGKAGSGKADSSKAGSGKAGSGKADSSKAGSGKADSSKADSSKARSSKKKSPSKKKSGSSKEEELFEPVLSGRLVIALALCMAMVFVPLSPLGDVIAKESPRSEAREHWEVGTEGTVHITVITADFDKLACADERVIEGMHCAYKADDEPFPIPEDAPYDNNKKNVIQPYRTTDGQLLFMAGLWAEPEVAMRLHNEPPRNVPEKKLARFVAECRVAFLEEWEGTKFRWSPRESWSQGETGMVARPLECRIFQG